MVNYPLTRDVQRERENTPSKPNGGFLSDIMGFGKTFQMIGMSPSWRGSLSIVSFVNLFCRSANIVDGRSFDPDDPEKTTLIVSPAHLTKQWYVSILHQILPGVS